MTAEAATMYKPEKNITTISLLERKSLRGGWIDTIEILADALGLSIDEYVGHKVVTKHG